MRSNSNLVRIRDSHASMLQCKPRSVSLIFGTIFSLGHEKAMNLTKDRAIHTLQMAQLVNFRLVLVELHDVRLESRDHKLSVLNVMVQDRANR